MKRNLLSVGVGIAIIVVVIAIFLFVPKAREQVFGMASTEFVKFTGDVIGTHTGTSTVGVGFSLSSGGLSATSSYISKIGVNVTNAIYMIRATNASTSAALAQFDIFGSADYYCDTTNTLDTYDFPKTVDINWYSAGDHLQNRTHLVDALNDSSSAFLQWLNPSSSTDKGVEILLTNLNYNCLKLNVAASSTVLFAEIKTK